jgi:hypothetical protein
MQEEIWNPIPDWDGDYEASSYGKVRSTYKVIIKSDGRTYTRVQKLLKFAKTKDGYECCALSKKGEKLKSYKVHRLIAMSFHGVMPNGYDVDHINGIRYDNRKENLRWFEKVAHLKDSWARGQMKNSIQYGERCGANKYSQELIIKAKLLVEEWKKKGSVFGGLKKISAETGIRHDTIKDISRGKAWKWLLNGKEYKNACKMQ